MDGDRYLNGVLIQPASETLSHSPDFAHGLKRVPARESAGKETSSFLFHLRFVTVCKLSVWLVDFLLTTDLAQA